MNEPQTLQPDSASPAPAPGGDGGPGLAFWGVGLALNLALIGAFVAWAIRQGKARGKRDD